MSELLDDGLYSDYCHIQTKYCRKGRLKYAFIVYDTRQQIYGEMDTKLVLGQENISTIATRYRFAKTARVDFQ
jgi:hypothetical protein